MEQEKSYISPEENKPERVVVEARTIADHDGLTNRQLMREVAVLKERADRSDKWLHEKMEICFSSLTNRIDALQNEIDKSLSVFSEARDRFQQRYDEKFNSVHIRFEERDAKDKIHSESLSRLASAQCLSITASVDKLREDSKIQVEEILRARIQQKADLTDLINTSVSHLRESFNDQTRANSLAVSKNEAAVSKQFDQIATLLNTSVSALNDKIDDLKGRILVIEGSGKGSKELSGILLTIVGLVIAAIAASIAFLR